MKKVNIVSSVFLVLLVFVVLSCSKEQLGFSESQVPQQTNSSMLLGSEKLCLLWKTRCTKTEAASPAIGKDGTLYFGAPPTQACFEGYAPHDPYLYALTPDGKLKWKFATGEYKYKDLGRTRTIAGVTSSIAIGKDGTVYFSAYDGYLYAVNPDGNLLWKTDLGSNNFKHLVFPPTIGKDGTIYGSTSCHLYAIKPDGTIKYDYKLNDGISRSPIIDDQDNTYWPIAWFKIISLDTHGKLRWEYKVPKENIDYLVKADDLLYTKGKNNLYVLDLNGKVKNKTKHNFGLAYGSSGTLSLGQDGMVYSSSTGYDLKTGIFAFRMTEGKIKWRVVIDNEDLTSYTAGIVGENGTIYVGLSNILHVIAPDGKVLDKFEARGNVRTPVIGPNKRLYFGCSAGYVYCLGEK